MEEVAEQLQGFSRRGALAEAARYIGQLNEEVRRQPAVALVCARMRARQGYNDDALALLSDARLDLADSGLRAALELERIGIEVLRDFDIPGALASAEAILATAAAAGIGAEDSSEALSIAARIKQMALVYYAISPSEGDRAHDEMWRAAEALEKAGRIEQALSAYHNHAVWPRTPSEAQLQRLDHVAEAAMAHGWPNRAGQALIAEAGILLEAGADARDIQARLDRATTAFAQAKDTGGSLDIERVRVMLGFRNGTATAQDLEKLVAAYDGVDRPKDAFTVLMDLSRIAHEQGDVAAARQYRLQELERVEATGLRLARIGADLALVDISMRSKRLSDAIDVCLSALARPAPQFVHAQFRQFLATCYAFAGDLDKSLPLRRQALADLEALEAGDLASLAATQLANQLLERGTPEAYAEARALSDAWIGKDLAHGRTREALNNIQLAVQGRWQEYVLLPRTSVSEQRLDETKHHLERGEQLAATLPPREALKEQADLGQLRGSIRSARGAPDEPEHSLAVAIEQYESGGWAMQAANSRYLVGVIRLNATLAAARANARQAALAHFGPAESNLNKALAYYQGATMRQEAAQTRFMLARHYANTAGWAPPALREQLTAAALQLLEDAFAELDAVRREFASGKATDAQVGKLTFAEKSRSIVELALEILLPQPTQWPQAWAWVQRGKSRALADLLGLYARPPRRTLEEIQGDPDDAALLARQRDLVGRLASASPEERPSLRAELDEIRTTVEGRPRWQSYLAFTTGAPASEQQLAGMFEDGATGTRPGVCVDWVAVGDRLYLIAARPGEDPQVAAIDLSVSQAAAFVRDHLGEHEFRQTLRDLPEILLDIAGLVAPLSTLTHPDELLVLCPTGPLHAVPLHALSIDDQPLLLRNPLVYTHGLGIAQHGIQERGNRTAPETMAVFGDPASDRAAALELVEQLAARYRAHLMTGREVTREALVEALRRTRYVHFQGHAGYEAGSPLDSSLEVAAPDGQDRVTAREIMDLGGLETELVSLGACESAASAIRSGDEPLGIAPALLVAGAGSVLAALWRVEESASRRFMAAFYSAILDAERPLAKVDALRAAAKAMMLDDSEYAAPYHWAPYVLYGDWL